MREKRLAARFDPIQPLAEDTGMRRARVKILRWAAGAVLTGVAMLPSDAAAQSQLDVAEAEAFLGEWIISMQTDYGPFQMNLDVADQDGKVAANIGSPEMDGAQPITDISRSEESLVLRFDGNAQGQYFDVAVTLEPNGEDLDVWFEVGTGEFSASGVATRASS
jgi:hypothetical protein